MKFQMHRQDISCTMYIIHVFDFALLLFRCQIKDIDDIEKLKQLATDNFDLLIECGISKPPSSLELGDKTNVMQAISLHRVILGTMAELSQFKEGLSVLGVCDAMKKTPELLYSFYCNKYTPKLSSDFIRKLFSKIVYSDEGSNDKKAEERAFMFFVDYMDECEKGTCMIVT